MEIYKWNGNGNEMKMEQKTPEVNIYAMLFCYYLFMLQLGDVRERSGVERLLSSRKWNGKQPEAGAADGWR